MFVVDTNILVYAAAKVFPKHGAAAAFLDEWRAARTPWFLTWGILYEFMRVTTHPRVLKEPWTCTEAYTFAAGLLASPSLTILQETENHQDVLNNLFRRYPQVSGNRVHDAHIAALMVEHGIREIRTTDADFRRFQQLIVVNPFE